VNIWTQEGGSERRIVLWRKVWTQKGGRERRMMLRGIFRTKREEMGER